MWSLESPSDALDGRRVGAKVFRDDGPRLDVLQVEVRKRLARVGAWRARRRRSGGDFSARIVRDDGVRVLLQELLHAVEPAG